MYSLEQFRNSQLSLVIYHEHEVAFESTASDLRSLVEYLVQVERHDRTVTIFDKYVGRAAASLMVLAKANRVFGLVVSAGGAEMLEQHGIPLVAGERVRYLMGTASEEMCRWEKLSLDKAPEELFRELKTAYGI
jgi:hypothetical protein